MRKSIYGLKQASR
jgi:hypothetical protein